jgi:hypothetical protein
MKMRAMSKVLITAIGSVILFSLTCLHSSAQTPQEYFVTGANLYIDGETDKARSIVDAGLTKYPDDKKLKALQKAIEEDKKDQDQNQDQNKENKQEQNKDQNKDQGNNKEQQQDKAPEQQQGKISKEDAQRLLDALANDEKNVQEKVKEAKAAKAKVRTLINW